MSSIKARSEHLRPYIEREISLLSALNCDFILKLEGSCFISEPTEIILEEYLVLLTELAEGNLDSYIMNFPGLAPEE